MTYRPALDRTTAVLRLLRKGSTTEKIGGQILCMGPYRFRAGVLALRRGGYGIVEKKVGEDILYTLSHVPNLAL